MYQKSDGTFEGVNPVEFSDKGGKQRIAKSFGFDSFEAFEAAQRNANSASETEKWVSQLQPVKTTRSSAAATLAVKAG